MYLCTFDISGIQRTIFSSSVLRDTVAASDKVARVLDDLIEDASKKTRIQYRPISSAGGNAQVKVDSKADAQRLVRELLRLALLDYPDLVVLADIASMEKGYRATTDDAWRRLSERKVAEPQAAIPDLPGVIERCARTGGPAWRRDRIADEMPQWVSRSIWDLRTRQRGERSDPAWRAAKNHKVMEQALQEMGRRDVNFFAAVNEEIHRDEQNYFGLIHIDANQMGRAFRLLQDEQDVREASDAADQAAAAALAEVIQWLMDRRERSGDTSSRLPLRPLICAGDDLTVLAEGSVAIDLAELMTTSYVRHLRACKQFQNPKISACAGVALGKMTAPSSHLYKLANRLCKEAKQLDRKTSLLDWGFLEEGPPEERSPVSARPYALEGGARLSFSEFRKDILTPLQKAARDNPSFHTQLKALAADLRTGPAAAKRRRELWKTREQDELIKSFKFGNDRYGDLFLPDGRRSPYADALDLLDFAMYPGDGP